ncbi:MAG: hypothetical protein WA795_07735, partial [Candidatus Sulfotelmatobacter sp.]
MRANTHRFLAIALCATSAVGIRLLPSCQAMSAGPQTQQAAVPGTVSRPVGAIKAINGTQITLTPDSGSDVSVAVQPTTRILRIAPGEKDLKNATPIQLQDLQIGDRILVGGRISVDGLSVVASTVVVMKHSDLEARHQQDLQDWQKRGVGGIVKAVDMAAGTVTISVTSFSGSKNIIIRSSKTTVIRRYGPDSAKFDDARPSTLQEIHPDDQVSARGNRSADGTEVAADEIVSGSFRNIAGTINSVDASSSTLSVHDLLSNKTALVKITQDSLLRQLPPEMAQRIAVRWKGAAAGVPSPAGSSATPSPGGSGVSARPGGAPDFQQMINRLPAVTLADLHKGDVVMIVSTEGTASQAGTAVKLISGVEPILRAAPNASAAQA